MSTTTAVPFYKETSLPTTLAADAFYCVLPDVNKPYFEFYLTSTGAQAYRIPTESDIINLISNATGGMSVVADIAARDALVAPKSGTTAYVIDASSDATVAAGGASYIHDGTNWIKMTEGESLDVSVAFSNISGINVTAAQIQNAVAKAHAHANKTVLDALGKNANGDLTYDGKTVKTVWETIGW